MYVYEVSYSIVESRNCNTFWKMNTRIDGGTFALCEHLDGIVQVHDELEDFYDDEIKEYVMEYLTKSGATIQISKKSRRTMAF